MIENNDSNSELVESSDIIENSEIVEEVKVKENNVSPKKSGKKLFGFLFVVLVLCLGYYLLNFYNTQNLGGYYAKDKNNAYYR
jgi:hypothetical protein